MSQRKPITRAIAVQLSPGFVRKLDELAVRSGMSRHRYMIHVLERAVVNRVVVSESVEFSDEQPPKKKALR
jgi:hypothetical protein